MIGSQVVQSLKQFSNLGADLLTPNQREMELLNSKSCHDYLQQHQPEILIHTAWYTTHGSFWTAPENIQWRKAGLEMAKSFLENGGRRMIVLGTCAEYEWSCSPQKHYCVEKGIRIAGLLPRPTAINPSTLYGREKALYHQQLCELFTDKNGSSLLWGRVFFPFGYGEKPNRLIPAIIRALALNKPVNLSCGMQKRDFLFASDLGELVALLSLSPSGAAIEEVNLCSGQAHSIRDIGDLLVQLSGKKADLLCYSTECLKEAEWVIGSVEHRRQLLNWEPRHTIAQGLEKTWNWWLTEGRVNIEG